MRYSRRTFRCLGFPVMETMSARDAILHRNKSLTLCKQLRRASAVLVIYKTEIKLSTFFIIVQLAKDAGIRAMIIQTYSLTLYLCKKKPILGWQGAWLLPWRAENFMGCLGFSVVAAVCGSILAWCNIRASSLGSERMCVWYHAWFCWCVCTVCSA